MARVHTLDKGNGYGFHLASEKGAQYVRKIDSDSPAERAGITDGDRLLGVNDRNIIGVSHKDIVSLVRDSGDKVDLIVSSPIGGISMGKDEEVIRLMPRECTLERQESGFGFVLHSERINRNTGFYMTKIADNGAAWFAGVHEDDKIISIDGVTISNKAHADVVDLIKNKQSISMTLIHRHSALASDLAERLKVPAVCRDGEAEPITPSESTLSKTSTIAEINNQPHTNTTTMSTMSNSSNGTSASQSSRTSEVSNNAENNNEAFTQLDFHRMSLSELKATIRTNKKQKKRVDEINWSQNKNLFKEL